MICITNLRKELAIPAICGMAAPLVMVSLWALASILRPGYDQVTQTGSELGTGRYSIVMNANFVATGVLILIFWVGLLTTMHPGKWSKFGLVILAIAAVGEVATGIFPCHSGCPLNGGSLSQMIHTEIAVVFFGAIAFFPAFIGIGLNQDQHWASYCSYSIVTGVVSIWPLHCVFCRCPNIIPIPGAVAAILSRCTVSMDRNNGESTALFHKVSEKVGCEIGTRYKLLGQSEQTRMEQGDDNHRVL